MLGREGRTGGGIPPSAPGFTWQHGRGCKERGEQRPRWLRREAPGLEGQGKALWVGRNLSIPHPASRWPPRPWQVPSPGGLSFGATESGKGRTKDSACPPHPIPPRRSQEGKGAGGLWVCSDTFPPEAGSSLKDP